MKSTPRATTAIQDGDNRLKQLEVIEASALAEPLKSASTNRTCQERKEWLAKRISRETLSHRQPATPKSSRLVLLNNRPEDLPACLLKEVLNVDPNAQMRSWDSFVDGFNPSSSNAVDIIVSMSDEFDLVMRQMDELWRLRVYYNYSPRPAYLMVSASTQFKTVRFDIEQLGGRFLCLCDIPTHFRAEIEQIELGFVSLIRSSPFWRIVQEGTGETLQVSVYFVARRMPVRVRGSDWLIARLAAFIKHNGISRSLAGWQKVLADDPLFAEGGFPLPSIDTLKADLHRDFRNCLQRAFDEYRSGLCADRVIERIEGGTHAAKYQIRGEAKVTWR